MHHSSTYDFVIVGAGIAGLALSYFYKQQFPTHRVLVLERNKVGGGLSGRSGGHLMPGFEADFSEMVNILGMKDALALYQETIQNTDVIEDTIRRERMDAGFRRGYWIIDTDKSQFAKLDEFMQPRRLLEMPEPKLFESEALRANVNLGNYDAGLYFSDIAYMETPKFIYGLAAAVQRMGVEIREGTEYSEHKFLRRMKSANEYAIMTTRGEEIRTRAILFSGGDLLTRRIPSLHKRTATIYTARFGLHLDREDFKSLSPLQTSFAGCDTDLKNNGNAMDGDFIWFSMRRDGYFVLGFGGALGGLTHTLTQKNVRVMRAEVYAEARRILPFIEKKEYRFRLSTGGLNTSSNLFPILENLDGHAAYTISALSGIGLNQSVLLARALVKHLAGDSVLFNQIAKLRRGQVVIPRHPMLRRAAISVGMAAKRPGPLQQPAQLAVAAAKTYSRFRLQ